MQDTIRIQRDTYGIHAVFSYPTYSAAYACSFPRSLGPGGILRCLSLKSLLALALLGLSRHLGRRRLLLRLLLLRRRRLLLLLLLFLLLRVRVCFLLKMGVFSLKPVS